MGGRTLLVNGLEGCRKVLRHGQVLDVETLASAFLDNKGLGPQSAETVVQGMLSHVRTIAGHDVWDEGQPFVPGRFATGMRNRVGWVAEEDGR